MFPVRTKRGDCEDQFEAVLFAFPLAAIKIYPSLILPGQFPDLNVVIEEKMGEVTAGVSKSKILGGQKFFNVARRSPGAVSSATGELV